MRNNIKRVEGNAGLILEQTPKKKPYETLIAEFSAIKRWISLKHSSILVFFEQEC